MAGNGPPPIPTEILERRGSWKAKVRKGQPRPALKKIRLPRGLGDAGRARFRQLSNTLMALGVSSESDQAIVARYCHLYDQFHELLKYVKANGRFSYRGPNRDQIISPQTKLLMDTHKALVDIELQLGLTPAARTRVRVDATPEKTEPLKLADFMGG